MKNKYKVSLLLIAILLFIISGFAIYMKFFYHAPKTEETIKNESSIIDTIEGFGYTLDDRDSELMKNEFNHLKEILNAEEINYDEYAESLAKLFVIDLYSIKNKVNKYDVGSLEYIFETEQDKFKTKVMDTLYELVEDDSYNERVQKLPIVSEINVVENVQGEYELKDSKIDAYIIKLEWKYEEDLGYDNSAVVYIVKQNDKLYVTEYTP